MPEEIRGIANRIDPDEVAHNEQYQGQHSIFVLILILNSEGIIFSSALLALEE